MSLLKEHYSCEGVILTGSGTQALEVAFRLLVRTKRPGAPIALPAYSCFDVATAAVGARTSILFYDLDPETLAPDPESLRGVLAKGARALVAVSLFGFPLDWNALRACCEEAGATLIEDAAQALGSVWQGREGGSFGDMTILSFARGKGWTGGVGGALLLRQGWGRAEEDLDAWVSPARRGSNIRVATISLAQWGLGRPSLYGLPSALQFLRLGETVYREPMRVQSMASFSAGLALATWRASVAAVSERRRRASELRDLMNREGASSAFRPPNVLEGGESGYLRFPVHCSGSSRSRLQSREARSLGILGGYPIPLPELPAVQKLQREPMAPFPGARDLSRDLFTLPTHSMVGEGDLLRLSALLRRPASRS